MHDEHHSEREMRYPATRASSIGFLGRGRLASLAIMLALLIMAYVARERTIVEQRGATLPPAVPAATGLPATSGALPAIDQLIVVSSPAARPATARRHGGLLYDGRAQLVARVAQRLVDAARTRGRPFQFGVLADESERRVYAYEDGWILVTVGLIQLAATQDEVAAVLAESMQTIAQRNDAVDSSPPLGATSAFWMARAGYDPSGISSFRARLAANSGGSR